MAGFAGGFWGGQSCMIAVFVPLWAQGLCWREEADLNYSSHVPALQDFPDWQRQ